MTTRLQQTRLDARRSLHQEMSVPALLIIGSDDPVDVTVRIHDKSAFTGEIPGLDTARFNDIEIHLRFWRDELDGEPTRGAIVSVAEGEAYRVGDVLEPHGDTIDATVTRLTDAEADGLAVPE